jgi:glycosyltransferase involved in cell wall biosynthesis
MMDVSIIICCYNSEKRISRTLEFLSKQKLHHLDCEIILVDNNCIDSTTETAFNVWNDLGCFFPMVLVKEKNSGQAHARKAGVIRASGCFILFCDDDNWLDENYVMTGVELMKENCEIGVLGGRSVAVFETVQPFWFSSYQSNYAVGVQALHSGDISERGFVWGAGAFLRRDSLLKIYNSGFVAYCVGRNGDIILSGDDFEICCWNLIIGKKLWYDERLIFHHYISEARLSKEYYMNLTNGFNESARFINRYLEFNRYINKTSWRKILMLSRLIFGSFLNKFEITLALNYLLLITGLNKLFGFRGFEINLYNALKKYKNINEKNLHCGLGRNAR